MANPKRRHSNTRTRLRRSHDFLKLKSLGKCSNCGEPVMAHRICTQCGFYKGQQVITIKTKSTGKKEAS